MIETTLVPETDIVTTRMFPVSRDILFSMRMNPEYLAKWRGPSGFTNTFSEFNPVPGGKWVFVMHGPDGKDYPNESEFVEIIPNEKMVFNHIVQPYFQIIATCTEVEEGTHLEFRMKFNTKAECDAIKPYVVDANEQNMDRLQALLESII